LREVGAADDDGAHAVAVEDVALRMQVALIDANLDVVVFEQLTKGVGRVEVEVGGS
jgi:hypothetical protein